MNWTGCLKSTTPGIGLEIEAGELTPHPGYLRDAICVSVQH